MVRRLLLVGTSIPFLLLPIVPGAWSAGPPQDAGGQFGNGIASIGDLDGDSVPDLAVSDPLAGGTGEIHLYSGKSGKPIRTLRWGVPCERYGGSLAGVGDLDGDGRPDIVASAVRTDGNRSQTVGAFSGTTGKLIRELLPDSRLSRLDPFLAVFGDSDGDGTRDILVSDGSSGEGGSVHLVSAKSGLTLLRIAGEGKGAILGLPVASAGDVDGDGVPDVAAVGSPGNDGTSCPAFVRVYSGKTGKPLLKLGGMTALSPEILHVMPPAMAAPGDLDGDGKADVAVGAQFQWKGTRHSVGMVRAFSGAGGSLIWTIEGKQEGDLFGFAVLDVDDADQDGIRDVAVTGGGFDRDPALMAQRSRIEILSGKSGKSIRTLRPPDAGEFFIMGRSLASAGDLDGDGRTEMAVASWTVRGPAGVLSVPRVRVFSGRDGRLVLTLVPPTAGKEISSPQK